MVDRRVLHKGCCGDVHGHGVLKEKSRKDTPPHSREFHHELSSSDESDLYRHGILKRPVSSRSQSTDCTIGSNRKGQGHLVSKRSNSAAVSQRLFSSPTKATTAKVRAERTASDGKAMTLEVKKLNKVTHGYNGSLSNIPKLKIRFNRSLDENDHDSGHFSSDTEGPRTMSGFVSSYSNPDQ